MSGATLLQARRDEEHDYTELIDVMRKGQGVFNVLPLAPIKDEVDATIISIREAKEEILIAANVANL
jgi:hypothetical protein